MQNVTKAFLSGAAGAIALNLMHECARNSVPAAPRMDIVGMRAMRQLLRTGGQDEPADLRNPTLAADLVANTLYYSAAALGGPDHAIGIGAALGTVAGVGGVLLPGPMGLGEEEVNRTAATQLMVVGMYATAGLLAGLAFKGLSRRT